MLCNWVFRFAVWQHRDGLDNLPLLLSNSTFHDFSFVVAPHGFYAKAHSKVCD
jgi:hypothetical protein